MKRYTEFQYCIGRIEKSSSIWILIQCLLYPDLDMEIFAEIPLEKGTVLFEKEGDDIKFFKKIEF